MYKIMYVIQGEMIKHTADTMVTALKFQKFLKICGIESTVVLLNR